MAKLKGTQSNLVRLVSWRATVRTDPAGGRTDDRLALRGPHAILYESCAPSVRAAHQCRTSLSYSLSVEFVCICDSPEPLSYRFRRGATPAGLHRALARAHTRRLRPSDAAQLLARTGHGALLHSSSRPRHVVHQQHRTGLCSSMAGVQHTHHHHPECRWRRSVN